MTQGTATVSGFASVAAGCKTIRHKPDISAETRPLLINELRCFCCMMRTAYNMKAKFKLFRRQDVFYTEDTDTGKQKSLKTRDETEAHSLLNALNESHRQPLLNLHLARAYLTASDPAFVQRTWQDVMEQMQARGKESSRERYKTAFKPSFLDELRKKKLLETTANDFFAVFKQSKTATIEFLKQLHHMALNLGWIALPIVAPTLWPKHKAKVKRGVTKDEHETILAQEKNAEWKLYLSLLWETGASQSDAVNLTAEDIDWPTRTITYFRMKTGSKAQFSISAALAKVLNELPTTGALFPNLSLQPEQSRSHHFSRHCRKAGIVGITLHCYRYAWAERAKLAGMPERFAQAALGHNSKAVHRAYAKSAQIIVPTLEEYEMKQAANIVTVKS